MANRGRGCERIAAVLLAGVWIAPLTGCREKVTRMAITDFRDAGSPRTWWATFPEAYYRRGEHGNVDVVLHTSKPATKDPTQAIEQIVHIRTLWRPIPGTTLAEASMINATVSYIIFSEPTGISYDGSGFASFSKPWYGDRIDGQVEQASLRPKRRCGGAAEPFGPVRLRGEFHAVPDSRRVVKTLHEIERLLGPIPPYEPAAEGPEAR